MGKNNNLGPNKSFMIRSKVDYGTSIGFIMDISEGNDQNDSVIQQ